MKKKPKNLYWAVLDKDAVFNPYLFANGLEAKFWLLQHGEKRYSLERVRLVKVKK